MSRKGFSTIPALIGNLLDRFEKSPDASRLIAHIDPDGFDSVDARDAFDEALLALERGGGVSLIRKGPKGERVVTGARLADPVMLYRHADRRPSRDSAGEALSHLRARNDLPAATAALLDEIMAAWARGASSNGFPPGKAHRLGHAIDLAAAAHGRLSGSGDDEVDYRTFSRYITGDSKALERHVRQVAALMRRLFDLGPEAAPLDPADLLASAGIVRLAQPMLVRGPLALDRFPFPSMPFIGVPGECRESITLNGRPSYLLIIENFASFVRYVREIGSADQGLIFYSGGFPSRPLLRCIRRLASLAQVPTFHWGDMDAGGVQIFRYLERALALDGVMLRPHLMNTGLLRSEGVKRRDAGQRLAGFGNSAIRELAWLIGETGLCHEQEAFEPVRPAW